MRSFRGSGRPDRGRNSSRRKDNNHGRSESYSVKCDSCGKQCDVPFKPTSGKPVYCSSCFDKSQNDNPRRDRDDRGRDSRKRSMGRREPERFKVVCEGCGVDCEVPFKPTQGKPIFCDKCYGKNKENETDQLKKEFAILNKKLDLILKELGAEFTDEDLNEEGSKGTRILKMPRKRMVLKRNKNK